MPWLLWRYILVELLRTILFTTVVLVAVIAFGATIKPLADDNLLTIGQTIKYLVLVTVPMLQFALPFAAGFGATLVLHRLAVDNEIQAMAVSGLSYPRILASVAALGMVLLLVMVLLTQWVIPKFWGLTRVAIATDIIQLFQASIDRGTPFEVGDLQIFADRMRVVENPEDTAADTRLELWRVAAAKLDDDGSIEADFTATHAAVDVYRHDDGSIELSIILTEPSIYNRQTGEFGRAPTIHQTYPLSPELRDDPNAMTRGRLIALREDPDSFDRVARERRALAALLYEEEIRRVIDEELQASGLVMIREPGASEVEYTVEGSSLRGDRIAGGADGVIITRFDAGVARWEMRPERAALQWPEDRTVAGAGTFSLALENLEVIDLRVAGPETRRAEVFLPRLSVPHLLAPLEDTRSSAELLADVQSTTDPSSQVRRQARALERTRGYLDRDARGRLLERYAFAFTAPLVLLLGATLAIARRKSLPLMIYVWAFVPALFNLLLISGGRQMIKEGQLLGDTVLWSGTVVLVLLIALTLWSLRRH